MRRQKMFKLTRYMGGMHHNTGEPFSDEGLDQVRISARDSEDETPVGVAVADMMLEIAKVKKLKPGDYIIISVALVE